MKITLSGLGGTGKSSIAKRLAQKLDYEHYSSGDLQREIAKERGLTITEWDIKQQEDPKYDNMVDGRMRQLGQKKDNIVIDGWLAAHFVPDAIKIFLIGNLPVRAKRITIKREAESFTEVSTAIKTTKLREEVNRKRWLKFYDFDYTDKKNYDLVVDTTDLSEDDVFDKVYNFIIKHNKNKNTNKR